MKTDQQDFYRELLDNLSEGVYFVDSHRKILYWNRGAELISGYRREEVEGSHCWDNLLMHVDEQGNSLCQSSRCPLVSAMRDGSLKETEAYLRHKNGYRIPVRIRSMPLRDSEGIVTGAVEVFSDNSPKKALEVRVEQLQELAMADSLTGLANRRHMETVLEGNLERMHRYGWRFGILFIDIDNFKSVNDVYGHDTGDEVLILVARNLQHNGRLYDVAGRWGGEEFLVVSENVGMSDLTAIAERYRLLVGASRVQTGGTHVSVTLSVGGTLAQAGDTAESLVGRADELMYQSKKSGKNRVTVG